ncbi:MAG: YgjV family protein [Formivibrio sp.]|nr:YgjV family protein [Formivibrio sp.]
MLEFLSLAQLFGYLAFVLGVGSFLQMNDKHFKLWMTSECVAYAVHFFLLGNPTAVASTLVSASRSLLSMHTRSLWLAWAIVLLNIGLGFVFVKHPADVLPLIASSIATLGLFRLNGIRMRLVLLMGTLLWFANNIIAGSIGGSALEAVVAAINFSTILRMYRDSRRQSVLP